MLASMCRITVILDFRSPLTACGVTYGHDVDGRVQGIAIPKHHHSRGPFIESVLRKGASWPSNALEDEAQIIGGRIRTAISPAGETAGPGRQRHKSKSQGENVSSGREVKHLWKNPREHRGHDQPTPP